MIDYLKNSDNRFSLVLCDEAHNMRNHDTKTYKGAEVIMGMADAAVFLTATPVMTTSENLFNMLQLLDNKKYYNYQIFHNLIQQNKPFIEATSLLNGNAPLTDIASRLNEANIELAFSLNDNLIYSLKTTVGERFEKDPIYLEICELLNGVDTYENRARLQYLFSSISTINSIFTRTRKREVTMDMSQAEREPHKIMVKWSEREQSLANSAIEKIIDKYRDDSNIYNEDTLKPGGELALIQYKRQLASSVFATLNLEDNLDNGIDKYSYMPDEKFDKLLEIINEVFKHGTKKIIIFADFRRTLKYLQLRLKTKNYKCLMIHGEIKNRTEIVEEFRTNPHIHILLSSEVGSEGLDMQFCNSMVNYDLPWNPMRVEQRIGRIDRFGQQSPVVNIYNFVVADSIQEDIYVRLLDRIGIFRETIGDLEAILDAQFSPNDNRSIRDVIDKLETEFYKSKITPEERTRKLAEIERAIQNERENIRQLEEGLTNTLTNDAYFKDEINRIFHNNAYVTDRELRNFVEGVISQELTTCNLNAKDDGIYELSMPINNARVLSNFITKYQPLDEENYVAFNRFKNDIEDENSLMITFDQQVAYTHQKVKYLNIYHPLIQASLEYFTQNDDRNSKSFSYALRGNAMDFEGSYFYLGVYQLRTRRRVQGVEKSTETLLPLLYNIEKKCLVNSKKIIDEIYSLSQTSGVEYNAENNILDKNIVEMMRYDFADTINNVITQRREELERQSESERYRNEQQTNEYYQSLINNAENNIRKWTLEQDFCVTEKRKRELDGSIRLAQTRIKSLENDLEEHLAMINEDPNISIESNIVSINLIKIISA